MCLFIHRRATTTVLDWLDHRMLTVLEESTLRRKEERSLTMRGLLLVQEKRFLGSVWNPYQFQLKGVVMTLHRSVAASALGRTEGYEAGPMGSTKVDRLLLIEEHTTMSIPAPHKSHPTDFGLHIAVQDGQGSEREFFFRNSLTRRMLMCYIAARTRTSSQNLFVRSCAQLKREIGR